MTDVFVRPSTRKKTVSVDVELSGVKQAGPVQVVADMLDEKGAVKSFPADAAVAANVTQTLALSWTWTDPRLWDVGQPNLYTLRLKVKGPGLDDEYEQEFGFREFWVEGRKLFLNGTEIRLRQALLLQRSHVCRSGENFSEMGAEHVDARGDAADSRRNLDDADRKGYLVAQYVLNANKYMMSSGERSVWEQNRQHAFDRAAVWMRHYRNHPSVVMWVAGFNFFNSAVDADPRHVGRGGWDRATALAAPHGFRQGDVRWAQEA